jgi:hypothetical protein
MIRKSGGRFSDKIMLQRVLKHQSIQSEALGAKGIIA